MISIKYEDLESAFEFVSAGPMGEHEAYISLDSGEIYWKSDLSDVDELPDDFDTSDRYLAVPHKHELDLGKRLVERFTALKLPDSGDDVRRIFSHKGAYSRFRQLLESKGLLDAWYAFENEQVSRTLREWCAENGIGLVEHGGKEEQRPATGTEEVVIHADDVPWTSGKTGLGRKALIDLPGGPKVRIVRIEAGQIVPRHRHPDANEVMYVLEGELEMNGTTYGPGTCYYKPRGWSYGPLSTRSGVNVLLFFDGDDRFDA